MVFNFTHSRADFTDIMPGDIGNVEPSLSPPPSPAPSANSAEIHTLELYQYFAGPANSLVGLGASIILIWLYFKIYKDSKWPKCCLSKILAIVVMLPANFLVNILVWELFHIYFATDLDRCETYIREILWMIRFTLLPNFLIIICLGFFAVLAWHGLERASMFDFSTKLNVLGMILTLCVATIIFVINSMKDWSSDPDCYNDYDDGVDESDMTCQFFFCGTYVNNFHIVNLGWNLSECVVILCFTLLIGKNYYEPENRKVNLTPNATNVYHDLDGSLTKVITVLLTQLFLFTIYDSSVDSRLNKQVKIDPMFYIVTVLAVFTYIFQNDPFQELYDSAAFWANVLFYKWDDEPLFRKLILLLRFFGDVTVNLSMLTWILVILPYQAAVDDKGSPISFVLNLVAIFYVIGLDDIPEGKQKDIIFKAAVNDVETNDLLGDRSDNQEDEEKGTVSIGIESYHIGDKISDSPRSFSPSEQE